MNFLPDLLTFQNGAPVTAAQWPERRRELIRLLSRHLFGVSPAVLAPGRGEILRTDKKCCSGHAELEFLQITAQTEKGVFSFPAHFFRPLLPKKAPLFLLLNFQPDPYDMYCPIEEIIDQGFAVAVVCYKDVTSDDEDFTNGLAGMFTRPQDGTGFGKLSLWAWAASRTLDYLLTRPEIDGDHVAILGHSRLGKTALWCGAQDERIRYVFSNDAGCAGDALERVFHPGRETTRDITQRFPYWFCENYFQYAGQAEAMPFDQHFLLAASAPRFVATGSASGDLWADPVSQQLCCLAASPAWRLLGKKGFVGPEAPAKAGDSFQEGEVGFHLRDGIHFLGRGDWLNYMAFMRKHW